MMQVSIDIVVQAGAFFLCLLTSELMIRRLTSGAKQMRSTYKRPSETTLSFRFFLRNRFVWGMTYMFLWLLSGFFLAVLILPDEIGLLMVIFFFLGEARRDRPHTYAERTRVQMNWTGKWRDIALYRRLIDSQDPRLAQIIDTPRTLENLSRIASHGGTIATFDPDKMQNITARDVIEERLRRYLHFLMNDASKICTLEEIHVVLF
ncbi:MAG: hypothetical protein ACFFDR_14365, partial [Candidatus Thorarchaeota archaeon]